ncbi:MAG TPA: CAP domain-containing protein, partial [Ilumatobacteraceae bacterium]
RPAAGRPSGANDRSVRHTSQFRPRRFIAALSGALALAAGVFVLPGAPLVGSLLSPVAAAPTAASAYVAIQPCRLVDTRLGQGYTRIDALTIQVATKSICGLPSGATSLALTLTVVGPAGAGYLTAWPSDQARPVVSNLNFNTNQVRANGSITRVDSSGTFRVYTSVATQVVVDVVGAFVPSGATTRGRFVPRPSTRLFDSRSGAKLPPGTAITIAVPGGVPADATALALNITVTQSTLPGFVTEYPAGHTMPTASILNIDQADQTRAAAGIFPTSAYGVSLYLSGGGHIVVDLLGYFTGASAASSADGLYTAYDPTRLLDTRGSSPLGNAVPLYAGGGLNLPTAQSGSMAYNITSVVGDPGYITAYPAGTTLPTTSTVNAIGGDTVANFAITQVSNNGLGIYAQSKTHLLVDLEGWFSGPNAVATLAAPANNPPPVPTASFSACTSDGMSSLNAKRSASGVAPLAVNPQAQAFACAYALQLAKADNGLTHSASATRDAAIGCPTGENIAYASGTSTTTLINLWFGSAPHLANIKDPDYKSAGLGFVIRTEPDGEQTTWGVTDFALC